MSPTRTVLPAATRSLRAAADRAGGRGHRPAAVEGPETVRFLPPSGMHGRQADSGG